jgi:enoyl-CoA hydratase
MRYETIIYNENDRGIASITVNRPGVRNALNKQARVELRSLIQKIENNLDIKVLIITGAGYEAFISGADVTNLQKATPAEMEEYASTLGQSLYSSLEALRIPVIAAINGYCLGGGLELALCCDIRIASKEAKFGQPEINLGFMPGGGSTQRLPRLIGVGRAKELLYTGRIITAAEAEKIGLVDRLVTPDKLLEETHQVAETIAGKSQLIISLIKKTINQGMHTDLTSGLAYEKANFALCFATEDHLEGIRAFLEKRTPKFKGK